MAGYHSYASSFHKRRTGTAQLSVQTYLSRCMRSSLTFSLFQTLSYYMSILLLCFFVDNSYLSPCLSILSKPVALSMVFVLCPHAVEAPQQQQIVQHLDAATEVECPAAQQRANTQQQRAQVNITNPQLTRVSSTNHT